MYSIGEISKIFNIPISTLRYYDKEGLFPNLKRKGNIRYFGEKEIELLHMIECLKKSDFEIKNIKQFFEWCNEGKTTYSLRKQLFEQRKMIVEKKIEELEEVLLILKYKCWYYQKVIEKDSEDIELENEKMPLEIKRIYEQIYLNNLKKNVSFNSKKRK